MLQSRSQRYALLKYGGYALLLLGVFLLQSSRGTAIRLWGASPNALPFLVAAVALLEGPYAGGSFGFACGLLLALNSTGLRACRRCIWRCSACCSACSARNISAR